MVLGSSEGILKSWRVSPSSLNQHTTGVCFSENITPKAAEHKNFISSRDTGFSNFTLDTGFSNFITIPTKKKKIDGALYPLSFMVHFQVQSLTQLLIDRANVT